MPYYIAIYDWSLYALPGSIPFSDIEGNTHSNDPASPAYNAFDPSWIGATFTFNGGASTSLEINDDDDDFEDGYVETGGAQTLAQDVTINGTTYPAGSIVENEFSMLDASGNEVWVVSINGVNVGFAYPASGDPGPGDTFTGTVGRDGDPADSGDGTGSAEPYDDIICFTPGTMILTGQGERPIETLQRGDMIVTRDHGLRPIRWLGRRTVPGRGRFAPVWIGSNVLDGSRDGVLVSPQHRMLFVGYQAELLFGQREVLIPAKHLVDGKDAYPHPQDQVTYIHLMFDHHEVIYAEGIATESFHAGDVGLTAVCEAAREELFAVFPELRTAPGHHLETARTCLKKHEARLLATDGAEEAGYF